MNDSVLKSLNSELERALINFQGHHAKQDEHRNYYLNSAFYPQSSGRRLSNAGNNMLRVFADMNIKFNARFPNIKVPTTGADPLQRQSASIREKILLAAWKNSGADMLARKWAFDETLFSESIAETGFDLQTRRAFVRRWDPRHCFYQISNGDDQKIIAFWVVFPITRDEAIRDYGVYPTKNPIAGHAVANTYLQAADGKDWFVAALRLDADTRAFWIGDQIVEEPHKHMMKGIPIDRCVPLDIADQQGRGGFYLDPMINLQADLNYTIQRRDAIVTRYSMPVMWAQNMNTDMLEDLKDKLKNGGFIGLKENSTMGILQLQQLSVLVEHELALRQDMLRLSGFSQAAMGELAGANTSGDALGMYFTPTQRHIEYQQIAKKAFYTSINAKILCAVEAFTKTGESVPLAGYSPRGTLEAIGDPGNYSLKMQSGGFDVSFTKEVIDGNYSSIVEMSAITPKNEIEEKRLVVEMVSQKVISRTTAFEMLGLESPEDELAMLTQEQSEPALNPQGTQQLVAAQVAAAGLQQPQVPKPLASGTSADVQQPAQ